MSHLLEEKKKSHIRLVIKNYDFGFFNPSIFSKMTKYSFNDI